MEGNNAPRDEEKSPSRVHYDSERSAFKPPYVLQRAFTERVHELRTLDRLAAADLLVDFQERAKYALELSNYHRVPAGVLAAHFQSSTSGGLDSKTAEARLAEHGKNIIAPPKQLPLWVRFIQCFFVGFAPLLWFAAGVVFLSWKPFGSGVSAQYNLALAVVLLLVITVAGLFQFHQEVVTSRALSGFSSLIPPSCLVLRNGVTARIEAADLVVGDVVMVESGGRVPADLRIFEASRLRVDKSLLTGESEPVVIHTAAADADTSMLESLNMTFTGCNITEGQGKGIVIATGTESQLSKIAASSSGANGGRNSRTSLQREIDRFVFIIACVAAITALTVTLWWVFYLNKRHKGFMNVNSLIANAISVLVAYVPEGLPLALSMGLAIIARRLCVTYNVLLKRLGTVETLGSMSLLASDKTGTLTQNRMTVVQLLALDAALNVAARAALAKDGEVGEGAVPEPQLTASLLIGALCNQSQIETVTSRSRASTGDDSTPGFFVGGDDADADVEAPAAAASSAEDRKRAPVKIVGSNGIDKALLSWACAAGAGESLRGEYTIEARLPFSSVTKTSHVVVRRRDGLQEPAIVLAKGAPEYIVAACSTALDSFAASVALTPDVAKDTAEAVEAAAAQGQRVVGLAWRTLPIESFPVDFKFSTDDKEPNFPTDSLQLVSCVAVSDPPREGVSEAVEELRGAGIKIAMVTGDAPSTALAIARQTGVVSVPEPLPVDTLDVFLRPEPAPATQPQRIAAIFRTSSSRGKFSSHNKGSAAAGATSGGGDAVAVPCPAVLAVGSELMTLSAEGWNFLFQHEEMVFARTTPEQKLQIVKESQLRGHRVGVTGDGVNDAPALRRSDVGVAMNTGADAAKDAAAIVLLNDDFASIVHAVQEGRLIFTNLRRVIAYQISAGCWAELLPVLATFFIGMPQPLSTLCMILISCITDVFAGVALMNERAESAIMKEPPRDVRKSRLVDFRLIGYAYWFYANLVSVGAFLSYFVYMYNRGPTGVVPDPVPADGAGFIEADFPAGYTPSQLIFAWNWALADGPLGDDMVAAANSGSSVFFLAIVVGQMGHLLSIRRKTPYFAEDKTIRANLPPVNILLAWCGSVIVALILTEIPAINGVAGTGSVPALNWGIAFGWSILCFLIAEARKWIIYKRPNSFIGKTAW